MTTAPISDVKRTLLLTLGSMGASSAATGIALLASGHRAERDRAFARQFVAWGGINVGIAAVGLVREGRVSTRSDADDRRKLHRLLLLNSALDVGYVAAGAAMVSNAERLGRLHRRYSADAARGDGAGIVIQGALLLGLDTVFALRMR